MPITSLFRVILISGLVVTIIAVIAGASLSDSLPLLLQEYLAQVDNEEISGSQALLYFVMGITILILLLISTVGLWKFKGWARTLYVVITLAFIPVYPFLGPVVMNEWEAMFSDIALILEGILLAMMFTGDVSKKFQASRANANS